MRNLRRRNRKAPTEEQDPMTMMAQAPTARPAFALRAVEPESAELRHRRVRLSTGSAAAALASGHVRAAIAEWRVPVDLSVAGILASDLIINAVTNGAGETLMLAIRCSATQFRVEIHDASVRGDSWETVAADADAERGLLLAAALAAESGHYRTPAGRAVFYVLTLASRAATGIGQRPQGTASEGGEP
jgi:hypothetical protein